MNINWSALGAVFVVALASGVGVVVLFTLGVVALGKRTAALQRHAPPLGANATAGLCFLACVALVGYGLYLVVA